MKQSKKKLRGCKGESIGETLIALLISSLALLMLAGAVSSAANIVTTSKQKMVEYYTDANSTAIQTSNKWKSVFAGSQQELTDPDQENAP